MDWLETWIIIFLICASFAMINIGFHYMFKELRASK